MRHKVKKIKIKHGLDSNRALVRKLVLNFLNTGYIKTTVKKAKILKSFLEKLVTKMKVKNEANKNFLLKYLGDKRVVDEGFEKIGPVLSTIKGGYVKIIKLGLRGNDGSYIAKVIWAYPVVKEKKVSKAKKPTIDHSHKNINQHAKSS